jgi:hypothetical protein
MHLSGFHQKQYDVRATDVNLSTLKTAHGHLNYHTTGPRAMVKKSSAPFSVEESRKGQAHMSLEKLWRSFSPFFVGLKTRVCQLEQEAEVITI